MQAEHQCFTGASGRRGWEPTVLQRDPFLTKRKMVSEGVTKSLANSGTNNFGTYYCVCFTYDGIFFHGIGTGSVIKVPVRKLNAVKGV